MICVTCKKEIEIDAILDVTRIVATLSKNHVKTGTINQMHNVARCVDCLKEWNDETEEIG